MMLVFISFLAYWTPTFMAIKRQVPHPGRVAVVNLLAGWTVLGWFVALAMAARKVSK